jgi:hypothetical protein
MFWFTEFRTRARYPIPGNATGTPRSSPNAGHTSAVRWNQLQCTVSYLEVQYRGRTFFHHGYSHRQQPDYVSSVDKSGFRVTHSRSKILSQDHDNDHLRAQAEALLPNASSICCTEPHTALGTHLSCRHEGRRHQVATWGYKNRPDCQST